MNCYQKLCTEFYDIDKPEAPADALAFFERYAREANGPILEPMCGTGRFLGSLLQRGYDVDGIDASPQMLDACRAKCRQRGLAPRTLEQQFLHEMDLPRKYKLVFVAAGSFGLIPDRKQVRESLRRIHNALLPGGKFVFETGRRKPKESNAWPWGGRWVERADGAKIVISWLGHYEADGSISRSIHRYELIRDGRLLETEFEDFQTLHLDICETTSLLEACGFASIRMRKLFDQCPPADSDEEVVIECSCLG
jgi:SAM-dependent methyltransferase